MTDDEPLPLNLWSETRPNPDQMETLRQAKQASGVTAKCKPVRAIAGCGRVLSFEGRPPFFCDWAETSWDDPKLARKIAWALTGEGGNPHTGLEWLQAIDAGITQLPNEDYEERVRFR
jgi:hypothetical protein